MKRVLSYSGGKDSTAMYLLALEKGVEFEAVFADTGHEHEATYDYVRDLPRNTGGPEIRWVRQDFSANIERRQEWIRAHWPEDRIERAIELLQPTGIPFLDLCLWKGRFPSARRRFCTEFLKHVPVFEQVLEPYLDVGETVVSWQGVRREESASRALLPWHDTDDAGFINFRPIFDWTWQDVFEIHRRHGVEPNPLYTEGAGRVGCMPCIMVSKEELRNIYRRWPQHLERIAEWEVMVADVSKRGLATFFAADKTPGLHRTNPDARIPGAKDVALWSMTGRGGRLLDIFLVNGDVPVCQSLYGLCE